MRDTYKHLVSILILFIFSFCILNSPAKASKEPNIPKNKVVVLVYDDSGSMWRQSGASGKNSPIDNWKYANYALQSFAALLNPNDHLKVIYMSSPTVVEPIQLDEKLRQMGIDQISTWVGKSDTPIASLHTAINELNQSVDKYEHSEFWFIVLTDGIFNEINSLDKNIPKSQIEKNKNELFARLSTLKQKMDKKDASFHATLIPIETYLSPQEKYLMADFTEKWNENSNGMVLESNGEEDIIQRINQVAALMTNRDPNEEEKIDLNPVWQGNQLILHSPFPLRKITIMEQSVQQNDSFHIKKFTMNNQLMEHGIEGPYKVKTPDDPAHLHPPIQGNITHLKNANSDGIIESGTYQITLDQPITENQKETIQVLAEPAIDFKTTFQKKNEDGRFTNDPSLFFLGSKMQIETTLVKAQNTDEEIDLRNINVDSLFTVEAQIDGVNVPLRYDHKLNKFVGDFPLQKEGEIPVKVTVHIKGFYQQEKDMNLKANPVRKMELVGNTNSWSAPLDKLDQSDPLVITPMINGKEISAEELKKIYKNIKIETESSIKIEKKLDGNKILISPKTEWPVSQTTVGKVNLHITLHGLYPKEVAEGTFTLNIIDISFLKKYGILSLLILLLLLLIVYVVGIMVKPRFDKNRIFIEYKQKRRGRIKDVQPRTLNFQGKWMSRWLVPYKAEKVRINDLIFKAHPKKDRVYLVKECQESELIVNHQRLGDQSKKDDILIMNNDEIQFQRGVYDTIYTFKLF